MFCKSLFFFKLFNFLYTSEVKDLKINRQARNLILIVIFEHF